MKLATGLDGALERAAAKWGLPAALVRAMVEVESGGDSWAWNPEPDYRYLWDVRLNKPFRPLTGEETRSQVPPRDFPALAGDRDQEFWAQQASFGLLQVMGAVARERGFRGSYLTALCDPATNLEFGCSHLAVLFRRHFKAQGWPGVVASYNAGSPCLIRPGVYANQRYVDKITIALRGEWPAQA